MIQTLGLIGLAVGLVLIDRWLDREKRAARRRNMAHPRKWWE